MHILRVDSYIAIGVLVRVNRNISKILKNVRYWLDEVLCDTSNQCLW